MNSTTTTPRTQIANFVAAVFDRDDLVEVRRIPAGRSTWHKASELSWLADDLAADNATGQHIYIGVNPRTHEGGRKAADVAIGRVAWADFDDTTPADAMARCAAAGMLEPTAVVNSGHGAHVYWRLTEPIPVSEWSDLQRDLAALLGCDGSVHDAPRLTRLPGFENPKPPAGSCYIVSVDPERRYTLSALRERIPVAPQQPAAPETKCVRREAASLDVLSRAARYAEKWESVSEGGRNSAAMRHAAQLRRDFAMSYDDALPVLRSWNAGNTPPLDETELSKCLQNGEQYGKHAVGCLTAR